MFGVELYARPKRRGLFKGGGDPVDANLRVLQRLIPGLKRGKSGGASFSLFPGTRVRVVGEDGAIVVRAPTAAVGPGYQLALLAHVEPMLAPLELAWEEPPERDAAEIERDMCAWIASALSDGVTEIGMPKKRTFVVPNAAVLTPLGPRDAAWKKAVIAEPIRAADIFAWRRSGPGQLERARALRSMWHEVPWREPLDDDEREMMTAVHADLRAATRADVDLDVPWTDWAELVDLLEIEGARADEVRARGGTTAGTIGYRRYDLEVEVSGGWCVLLPGGFLATWENEGERFLATDGERAIEVTTLTAEGETDSEKLLNVAPERFPVAARLSDQARRGRAEVTSDGGMRVIHGLMAAAPDVAILTIRCPPEDEAWALATWRSLERSVGEGQDV